MAENLKDKYMQGKENQTSNDNDINNIMSEKSNKANDTSNANNENKTSKDDLSNKKINKTGNSKSNGGAPGAPGASKDKAGGGAQGKAGGGKLAKVGGGAGLVGSGASAVKNAGEKLSQKGDNKLDSENDNKKEKDLDSEHSQDKSADSAGGEFAKDKGKQLGKKGAKKAGKGVKKLGKAAGKAATKLLSSIISFLVSNPIGWVIDVIILIILIILIIHAAQENQTQTQEEFSYKSVLEERYTNTDFLDSIEFSNMAEMVYYEQAAKSAYSYSVDKVTEIPDGYDEDIKDNQYDTGEELTEVSVNSNNIFLNGLSKKDKDKRYKVKRKNQTVYTITGTGEIQITKDGTKSTYNLDDGTITVKLNKGDLVEVIGEAQATLTIGPIDKEHKEDEILMPYQIIGFLNETLFSGTESPEVFLNTVYSTCADGRDEGEACKTLPLTGEEDTNNDDLNDVIAPTAVLEETTSADSGADINHETELDFDDKTYVKSEDYCIKSDGTASGGDLEIDNETGKVTCTSGEVNIGVESWGFAPIFEYNYGNEYEYANHFSIQGNTISGVTLIKDDGTVPLDSSGNPFTGDVSESQGVWIFNDGITEIELDSEYSKLISLFDTVLTSLDGAELDPNNQSIDGWTITNGQPSVDIQQMYLISNAATFLGSFSSDTQMKSKNIGTTEVTTAGSYKDKYDVVKYDTDDYEAIFGPAETNGKRKIYIISGDEYETNNYCEQATATTVECGPEIGPPETINGRLTDYYYPADIDLNYSAIGTSPLNKWELTYSGDIQIDPIYDYLEDWIINLRYIMFSDESFTKSEIKNQTELLNSTSCTLDNVPLDENNQPDFSGDNKGCEDWVDLMNSFGYSIDWDKGLMTDIFEDSGDDDTQASDTDVGDSLMLSDEEKEEGAKDSQAQHADAWQSVLIYSDMYGVDPYLYWAILGQESGWNGDGDTCVPGSGGAWGIAQIECTNTSVQAKNFDSNRDDYYELNFGGDDGDSSTLDMGVQDDNIHAGVMEFAAKGPSVGYNPLAMALGYNYGGGGANATFKMSMAYAETNSWPEAESKYSSYTDDDVIEYLSDGNINWAIDGSTLWYSGATSTGWEEKWNAPANETSSSGCTAIVSGNPECYSTLNDNGDGIPSIDDGLNSTPGPHGDPLYVLRVLNRYYGDTPYALDEDGNKILLGGAEIQQSGGWNALDAQVKSAAFNATSAEYWEDIYGVDYNYSTEDYYRANTTGYPGNAKEVQDRVLADYAGVTYEDGENLGYDESLILLSFIGDSKFLDSPDISKFLNQVFYNTDFSPVLENTEDTLTKINVLVPFGRTSTSQISKGAKLDTSCKELSTKSCYNALAASDGVIVSNNQNTVRIDHGYVYKDSEQKYTRSYTEYENLKIADDIDVASSEEIAAFDKATLCNTAIEQGEELADCPTEETDVFAGIDENHYVLSGDVLGSIANSDIIQGKTEEEVEEDAPADLLTQDDRNSNLFEFSYYFDGRYYSPNLLITAMNGLLQPVSDGSHGGEGSASEQVNDFLEDNGCNPETDVFGKTCGTEYPGFEPTEDKWLDPFDSIAAWTLTDYAGHDGQDGNYPDDTPMTYPIYPVNNGVVVAVETAETGDPYYCAPLGETVVNSDIQILHYDEATGKNYTTEYAHIEGIQVDVGDVVDQNTLLAYEGDVGCSTAQHIHYNVGEGYGPVYGDVGVYEPDEPKLYPR